MRVRQEMSSTPLDNPFEITGPWSLGSHLTSKRNLTLLLTICTMLQLKVAALNNSATYRVESSKKASSGYCRQLQLSSRTQKQCGHLTKRLYLIERARYLASSLNLYPSPIHPQ
jgi:hypothetical protein